LTKLIKRRVKMIRHLKILLFGMALIGLMAGSAFAGTVGVNHGALNATIFMSLEALGAARSDTVVGNAAIGNSPAGNYGVTYVATQDLTATNLLGVSFTGGGFNGDIINLCKIEGADNNQTQIGTGQPSAGTTSYNFQLSGAVGARNSMVLTNAACNATGARNFPFRYSATTSAGYATITIAANTSGAQPIEAAASANVGQIRTEYAVSAFNATVHTVDYLGTPGDGTRFTAGNNASAATNSLDITQRINTFTVNGGAGAAPNAGLTVGAAVSITDTLGWQGLSKVFLAQAGVATCADTAAGNLVGTGTLSGTLSLTVPAAAFDGNGANGGANFGICLVGSGTAFSVPRTIQASVDVNVSGTGANDPAATSLANIDTWITNAYQGFVGWLVNSSALPTYCLINNADTTRTGTILLDVVSSEGAVVLSGTLGTIAPKTSNMATFTVNSVSLTGGTALSLATLGADKRYTAKITTTVTPANVLVTCIQTDPVSGAKRSVPVFANSPNVQ
jgi:hypothetical protein